MVVQALHAALDITVDLRDPRRAPRPAATPINRSGSVDGRCVAQRVARRRDCR